MRPCVLLLALVGLVAMSLPCAAQAQNPPNVSGIVRDSKNAELSDVIVTAWRDGKAVAVMRTGKGKTPGLYEMYIAPDAPIDSITFVPSDLVRLLPTTLERLSGKDLQNVSVVIMDAELFTGMLRIGKWSSSQTVALCDQLNSLENYYILQRDSGMSEGELFEQLRTTRAAIGEVRFSGELPPLMNGVAVRVSWLKQLLDAE